MKRFALSFAVAIFFTCPLLGQQGSTDAPNSSTLHPTGAQVVKFMELMHARQRLQSSVAAQKEELETTVHNMFHKVLPDATAEQKAKFESIVASTLGDIFTNYPVDEILRDMIPIYQSHFSESDLNQIAAFYSSPVGQKVLSEMPAISAETMRVSNARLQPEMEEALKSMEARIREMAETEDGKSK
jgi:hypothetical protein